MKHKKITVIFLVVCLFIFVLFIAYISIPEGDKTKTSTANDNTDITGAGTESQEKDYFGIGIWSYVTDKDNIRHEENSCISFGDSLELNSQIQNGSSVSVIYTVMVYLDDIYQDVAVITTKSGKVLENGKGTLLPNEQVTVNIKVDEVTIRDKEQNDLYIVVSTYPSEVPDDYQGIVGSLYHYEHYFAEFSNANRLDEEYATVETIDITYSEDINVGGLFDYLPDNSECFQKIDYDLEQEGSVYYCFTGPSGTYSLVVMVDGRPYRFNDNYSLSFKHNQDKMSVIKIDEELKGSKIFCDLQPMDGGYSYSTWLYSVK